MRLSESSFQQIKALINEALKEFHRPQEQAVAPGQKVYVCPVCGYEHIGDIHDEADDYTCPLCGQPKAAFQEKQ